MTVSAPIKQGVMHGREIKRFVCSASHERVLHQVSAHAAILASDSLADKAGMPIEANARQTLNFRNVADLNGMKPARRCSDCTLQRVFLVYYPDERGL